MMKSSSLVGVKERFLYAVNLGAIAVITGDVGSGKSSALRFASATLHPSEYRVLYITATSGTIIELYKQICYALNIEVRGGSKAVLSRMIKSCIMELVNKKERPVLIIDEASLIRLDVFSELHTLVQFEGDSKAVLPYSSCRTEQSHGQSYVPAVKAAGVTSRSKGAYGITEC